MWLSAEDQYALCSISDCADAIAAALVAGSSCGVSSVDPPRTSLSARNGQLLVMPSTATDHIGIKLVTVADSRSSPDTPRIQGVHVQFDPATLAPRAVLDGIALSNIRTAAVSVVALRALADPASAELLVFGAGPQALHHARGICAEWPISSVRVVSRRIESARRCAAELAGVVGSIEIEAVDPEDARVSDADIIVCATTSKTRLFASSPRDGAAIVAVGSHSPSVRELPGALLQRSYVAVEDRAAALREAGDIVLAISEGFITERDIDADLCELVRRGRVLVNSPRVFKSVGMAWQDAVVASAILARA
jgi:ornithine cyclodeaminase